MARRSRKIVTVEKLGSHPPCLESRKKHDLRAIRHIDRRSELLGDTPDSPTQNQV